NFSLSASASNVGMALRQFNTAVSMTNVNTTGRSAAGTLNSDGSAAIILTGATTVTNTGSLVSNLLCGLALGDLVWQCRNNSISVPIFLLQDHIMLDASDSDNGWFVRNKWHELSYYAIAPDIAPSGTRS